jgi:hypothetical protein
MSRRLRHRATGATIAAVAVLGAAATAAYAYVTTDLVDFNLTESVSSYGSGAQFHVASGTDGAVSYRWLDVPSKTTVISGNSCADLSNLGSTSIPAGSTAYAGLFVGWANQCFVVRGRTASGSGSMTYYDGRIRR